MNHVYRLVWNRALGIWQVVSELTRVLVVRSTGQRVVPAAGACWPWRAWRHGDCWRRQRDQPPVLRARRSSPATAAQVPRVLTRADTQTVRAARIVPAIPAAGRRCVLPRGPGRPRAAFLYGTTLPSGAWTAAAGLDWKAMARGT